MSSEEGKTFPIQGCRNGTVIPWEIAEEAYIEYSRRFGTDQSLERLAERGGFGATELGVLLQGRVESLRGLLTEIDDYLDTNDQTNIAHGSALHRKVQECLKEQ